MDFLTIFSRIYEARRFFLTFFQRSIKQGGLDDSDHQVHSINILDSAKGFVKKLFLKSHTNVNFPAIFLKRPEQSGFSEGYFFKDNRGKLIFWTCFFRIYRAKRFFFNIY